MRQMESAVESLRADDVKERLYMTFQQTIMEHEMWAEKRGEAKGHADIIMNMLQAGIPVEKIAEIAKITVEKVKEICKL